MREGEREPIVELLAVSAQHRAFFRKLFATTLPCGLDLPLVVEQQWVARERSLQHYGSELEDFLCQVNGEPAGRITLCAGTDMLRIVDIALLPRFRGVGVGTRLIQRVQRRARMQGVSVQLSVLATNPVVRLYEQLGFIPRPHGHAPHLKMSWAPNDASSIHVASG